MNKFWKIAVVVSVVLSLCLFCVFGVSAASERMTWCTDPAKQYIRSYWTNYGGGDIVSAQTVNIKFSPSGNVLVGVKVAQLETSDPVRFHVEFNASDTFLYTINPDNYYSFYFTLGQASDHAVIDEVELDIVAMTITDSEGNSIRSEADAEIIQPNGSKNQWTQVRFEPSVIERIKNISVLDFEYEFERKLTTATQFSALILPYAQVSVTNPTLDAIEGFIQGSTDQITGEIQDSTNQITGEIQDSTDQITGEIQDSTNQITDGWDSDPVAPDGSDDIKDLENIEEDLLEQQSDGFEGFGSIFNSFSENLTEHGDGLHFVAEVLEMFIDLDWGTFVSAIVFFSLTIGFVSYLLNLAPKVASRISRRW